MFIFVIGILLSVPLLAFSIYKYNGKKQILSLDFVQFMYLFVFMPILYVWGKAFLFYLLLNEVGQNLSKKEIFTIDTIYSIVSIYIFAAVAIHSLTKTFWLRKQNDPNFDLYYLSEYFHLWWSHILMNAGVIVAVTFLSTVNVFIPFEFNENKMQLIALLLVAIIVGAVAFLIIWSQDPQQEKKQFLRLMKLILIISSIFHIVLYFIVEPRFSMDHSLYWFIFGGLLSATIFSFSFVRSNRAKRLRLKFLHPGWGENIEITPVKTHLTGEEV